MLAKEHNGVRSNEMIVGWNNELALYAFHGHCRSQKSLIIHPHTRLPCIDAVSVIFFTLYVVD